MEHLFSFTHPSNGRIQKQREHGRVLISGRLPFPHVQGLLEAHLYLEGQVQADLGDTAGVVPDPCSEASNQGSHRNCLVSQCLEKFTL